MDTSTSTHSLAELPPEILYMIFDFLDMNTLKSVSETCHHLNDSFSHYYCGRFMLNIRLDKVSSRESPYNAEYAVKRILQSKRCYRKVHLPVHDSWFDPNHHMYSIMYRVLLGDWSNQLVVLILEMDETTELCGATITTALHHMDHLKELRFLHTHEWNYPIQIFLSNLVVENHTLELLELEVVVPAMIHCRKLRQLIVSPHLDAETQFGKQYAQHGEAEPFWKLKHLEEFTLKRAFGERPNLTEHRPGYRCKLYEHLTKLTKLHFHASGVSEKFLQSICKSCVLLEDLFIFSLQTVDSNVLARCLSNLTHLRRLGIWRITTPHPISFASINAPKLEQLTLGRVDVVWESVEQLRSLKSLSIIPYFHNALRIPESFAKHVKQIESQNKRVLYATAFHHYEFDEAFQELRI
uniref:F-box domain-containing protein n=1 Tax=Anopheles culicifacies TaxID=139723 RepID=A0A182MK87_9DIPT